MEETKPSAPLLYPSINEAALRITSFSEQYINGKILANNKYINNITIIKDIRNCYETEDNDYNKKLSRYKNYINVATTATSTSVAITGIGLPYSIHTAFSTATVH